jgi:predicted ArsR family transcriptional regulator
VTSQDFDQRVKSVAALADPVRRALYQYVVAQAEPVSREQAASGVGVAHHAAKFHLDKLEEDGLLDVEHRRPPGRRGPGAGRPAKHYKRTTGEIEVSLPPRHYDLAGELMAQAIVASETTTTPAAEALSAVAAQAGRELGTAARAAVPSRSGAKKLLTVVGGILANQGYEPRVDGTTITLANCPFHTLAQKHTELVCGMNLDLVEGLLQGLGTSSLQARLNPSPGRCCVTIAAS